MCMKSKIMIRNPVPMRTSHDENDVILKLLHRTLMEGTLLLARDLRPKGKWGFYGFPRCYNNDGAKDCPKIRQTENEQ